MATPLQFYKGSALPPVEERNSSTMYLIRNGDTLEINMFEGDMETPVTTTFDLTTLPPPQPEPTIVTEDTVLSESDHRLLIDALSMPYNITLPPVSSGARIWLYFRDGTHEVTIRKHPDDPSNIILGADSIGISQGYTSGILTAVDDRWYIY